MDDLVKANSAHMDKVKVQLQECADRLDQQEEIAAQFKKEMYNFAAKWQVCTPYKLL
jgi:hypothetical protein